MIVKLLHGLTVAVDAGIVGAFCTGETAPFGSGDCCGIATAGNEALPAGLWTDTWAVAGSGALLAVGDFNGSATGTGTALDAFSLPLNDFAKSARVREEDEGDLAVVAATGGAAEFAEE